MSNDLINYTFILLINDQVIFVLVLLCFCFFFGNVVVKNEGWICNPFN